MEPLPPTEEALRELLSYGDTIALRELSRISRQVVDVVPDCVGVSLSFTSQQLTFTMVADDQLTRELDAVQYIDDGPCLDALRTAEITATNLGDLLDEHRWQLFAQAQAAAGIQSTLTLPIIEEDRVVAGVNLYASTPTAFDGHHAELAAVCRAWAPGIMSNADLPFHTRHDAAAAPERLREAATLDQAVGMLAAAQNVEVDAAQQRIEQASVQAGITPHQAAEVVIRALSPRPD